MSSDPAKDKRKSREPRPNIMASSHSITGDLSAQQLETRFFDALKECTLLSGDNELESTTESQVVMAKMLRHCIRMLHSNGWVPRTVVRTMVHMEAETGSDHSVKSMMYSAMREKRDEARARRIENSKKTPEANAIEEVGDHNESTNEKSAKVEDAGVGDHSDGKDSQTVAAEAGGEKAVNTASKEVSEIDNPKLNN